MAILEASKVYFGYYGSTFRLEDVNFALNEGQRLVLYGSENSGKTTLMRVLCGLEEYSQGSILLGGEELKNMSQRQMNIGFSFDRRALESKATAGGVISYPMKLRGMSQVEIDTYLDRVSKRCNLPMTSQVKDLDGVQVAMLILARLFAVERRLYLVDDVWKDLPSLEKERAVAYALENLKGKSAVVSSSDVEIAKEFLPDLVTVLTESEVSPALSVGEIVSRPINMQSAIFAGYELHIGRLVKREGSYFASLYGRDLGVSKPIGDIYVGKDVCFAVKRAEKGKLDREIGDNEIMAFYYDLSNERIITR